MEGYVLEDDALPEWMRTTFVDEDGRMFLPCGIFTDELTATLCIANDGVPLVRHEGHVYAPASWLEREYAGYAHVGRTIVARAQAERERRGQSGPLKTAVGSDSEHVGPSEATAHVGAQEERRTKTMKMQSSGESQNQLTSASNPPQRVCHGDVACPVCGFADVHPTAVTVTPAGYTGGELRVDADGVRVKASRGGHDRGVRVAMTFAGECGHVFSRQFQFHKGRTEVSTQRLADASPGQWRTIWRE